MNNAFFNWQLTHEAEQDADRAMWPELYRDPDFQDWAGWRDLPSVLGRSLKTTPPPTVKGSELSPPKKATRCV